MVNDPIGDFIIRLTNAGAVKKTSVAVPYSGLKAAVAEKLVSAGYIAGAEKKGKKVKKTLDIALKYTAEGTPRISGVKRVSKPGRRVYKGVLEINPVRYGHGSLILSTPKGILTDKEAKAAKVGGEALFEIW
jgi:small subunit ribosomal protein S8